MANPTVTGTGEIQWTLANAISDMSMLIHDNDGVATSVLNDNQPFAVHLEWKVPAGPIAEILGGSFRMRAFAESMGPGVEKKIGADLVVPVDPGRTDYLAHLNVPAFTLPGESEGASPEVSGLYRIVAVLQHVNGVATQNCGYAEGPLVQIRTP